MRTPSLISILYLSFLVNSLPHAIPSNENAFDITRRAGTSNAYEMNNMPQNPSPPASSSGDPETSRDGMYTAAQKQKGKATADTPQPPQPAQQTKEKSDKQPASQLGALNTGGDVEKGQASNNGGSTPSPKSGGTSLSSSSMGPDTLDEVGHFDSDSSSSNSGQDGLCGTGCTIAKA
jgi:hypothetical protein